MEIPNLYKKNLFLASFVFLIVVSLYFAVKFLAEIKSYDTVGSNNINTVTLSGHGEVSAVPDIANVYFTINKDSKTVKEAQTLVAQIEKKSLDFLKESGVLEKDIKTTNSSFYPKYNYGQVYCISYPCPQKNPVIIGYTASESITVKVRNTDDVGKIMEGLGTIGVSNLSGPNFSIDDEEVLKVEARKKAIKNAKEKAVVLAKDLGVRLGEVVSFNESGNYPVPMYAKSMMADSVSSSESARAEIPKGENIISSDVSITYQIK